MALIFYVCQSNYSESMRSFLSYYVSAIKSPSETFNDLISDTRNVRFGFFAVLIQVTVYTLVYLFLISGGGEPYKPWLPIAPQDYYKYNVFFLALSMLMGWILDSDDNVMRNFGRINHYSGEEPDL